MSNKNLLITSNKPSIEVSTSQHALSTMKKLNHPKKHTINPSIVQIPRSNTADQLLSHMDHNISSTVTLSEQQWNFLNQYPDNLLGSNERMPTKYITEIYDRATNRFIPTTCCY